MYILATVKGFYFKDISTVFTCKYHSQLHLTITKVNCIQCANLVSWCIWLYYNYKARVFNLKSIKKTLNIFQLVSVSCDNTYKVWKYNLLWCSEKNRFQEKKINLNKNSRQSIIYICIQWLIFTVYSTGERSRNFNLTNRQLILENCIQSSLFKK